MRFRSFSNRGGVRYVYRQTKELNLSTEYFKRFSKNTTFTSLQLTTRKPKPVSLKVLNRTLKTKMWKYFTHRETLTYVDVLSEMVASYDHTVHRTIGIPTSYKRTCQAKKDQTSADQATEHIE